MGKLNMKEWIRQTNKRKETIAIPIMTQYMEKKHVTGIPSPPR